MEQGSAAGRGRAFLRKGGNFRSKRRKIKEAVRLRNREVFLADTDRREQTCHR